MNLFHSSSAKHVFLQNVAKGAIGTQKEKITKIILF